jgi:transcriptional enhancer factor
LLCIAYVFEVSTSEHGAQHHIYRLVKDWGWPARQPGVA